MQASRGPVSEISDTALSQARSGPASANPAEAVLIGRVGTRPYEWCSSSTHLSSTVIEGRSIAHAMITL
jgi:hypothetical protein